MPAAKKALFPNRGADYARLSDEEHQRHAQESRPSRTRHISTPLASLLCLAAFLSFITLATLYWRGRPLLGEVSNFSYAFCDKPDTRQEWRSLTVAQREDYTLAVKCLSTKRSRLGLNHSLHDDFAYSHIWHGHDSHDGASFFAYHRWFLHLYEAALRDECGYKGNMIYWDWSLDWRDPYHAPVFDARLGFGGEGSRSVEGVRGYCVDDGVLPNYTVPFFETLPKPHCFSREFFTDTETLRRWAREWDPEYLETLLREDELATFIHRIEEGPHLALPKMLHGDFSTRGAPIDPLFMLHHTNLDRLYWQWQLRDPEHRLTEYEGSKTAEDLFNSASVHDSLVFGDLGPSVTVGDMLDTQGDKLCYVY